MDNLTHALVGAAVAKAGADRATPLAMATLVLAANVPDVDVLSYVRGSYFALSFRRGITHGWPALVLWPFVVTAVILGWDRWVRRRRHPDADAVRRVPTLVLATVGVLTHPTLDWMNTYGMRWGLPSDGSWSYGDALFIIDPWIWLALGGSVFLAARPGRRGVTAWAALAVATSVLVLVGLTPAAPVWLLGLAAISVLHRRGWPASVCRRRTLAAAATGAVAVYVCALVALDGLAAGEARRVAEAQGLTPRDIMVAPLPGRLLGAAVEVRTDDAYVPGTHRWFASPRVELRAEDAVPLVSSPGSLSGDALNGVIARARATPPAADYLVWSRYPFVTVDADGDAWRVRFTDARYDEQTTASSLAGVEVRVAR